MKQYPIHLELMLAESAIQAANNRKALVTDRIRTRLRHIISLCKPLTGFPTFEYSIDLQQSKIKATRSKISICRWFPATDTGPSFGGHVRYINIPTVWLEESTADANIIAHLEAWLKDRQARRWRRHQEEIEKRDRQRIEDLIKQAAQINPALAEEIKKWKLTKK